MPADFLTQMFGLDDRVAVVIGGTGVLGGALREGLVEIQELVRATVDRFVSSQSDSDSR